MSQHCHRQLLGLLGTFPKKFRNQEQEKMALEIHAILVCSPAEGTTCRTPASAGNVPTFQIPRHLPTSKSARSS